MGLYVLLDELEQPADCAVAAATEFAPEWRTDTVRALGRVAAAGDPAVLPVLADALEDAGCDAVDLLAHCRRPGTHAADCWAVRLVADLPAQPPVRPASEVRTAEMGMVEPVAAGPAEPYTLRTFVRNVTVGVATNVAIGTAWVIMVLVVRAALFGNPF